MSAMVRAPSAAIDWRSAPTRFSLPSVTWAGPSRIRSRLPTVPTRIRVPRGSFLGARQGRPQHERIGPGGDRLGELTAASHAAIGDNLHVPAALGEEHVT